MVVPTQTEKFNLILQIYCNVMDMFLKTYAQFFPLLLGFVLNYLPTYSIF